MFKRITSTLIIFCFTFTSVVHPGYAQSINFLNLPIPGAMVQPTDAYVPVLLRGMTIDPQNPLSFDFIIDSGNSNLDADGVKEETEKLVKYFLAAMTVPKDDLWVNLSPYEQDRIIPDELGKTALGRDLLAQDYILKQLTASMMYPEDELGQKFWQRVERVAREKYGIKEVPTDLFNKVWILPETASVYEHEQTVYVVNSRLKVMLDSDYENMMGTKGSTEESKERAVSNEIIREIILPEIEKEINQGQNFAPLRQIYHSLILAKWYKQNIKDSILTKIYSDQNKVEGITTGDPEITDAIYNRYMQAYEKGVFSYIKEDYDMISQTVIPRKYFSGGIGDPANIKVAKTDNAAMVDAEGPAYQAKVTNNPIDENGRVINVEDDPANLNEGLSRERLREISNSLGDLDSQMAEVLEELTKLEQVNTDVLFDRIFPLNVSTPPIERGGADPNDRTVQLMQRYWDLSQVRKMAVESSQLGKKIEDPASLNVINYATISGLGLSFQPDLAMIDLENPDVIRNIVVVGVFTLGGATYYYWRNYTVSGLESKLKDLEEKLKNMSPFEESTTGTWVNSDMYVRDEDLSDGYHPKETNELYFVIKDDIKSIKRKLGEKGVEKYSEYVEDSDAAVLPILFEWQADRIINSAHSKPATEVLKALAFIEKQIKKENKPTGFFTREKSYSPKKLVELLAPLLGHDGLAVREKASDLLIFGEATNGDMIDAFIKYGLKSFSEGPREMAEVMLRLRLTGDRARQALMIRAEEDTTLLVDLVAQALEIGGMNRTEVNEFVRLTSARRLIQEKISKDHYGLIERGHIDSVIELSGKPFSAYVMHGESNSFAGLIYVPAKGDNPGSQGMDNGDWIQDPNYQEPPLQLIINPVEDAAALKVRFRWQANGIIKNAAFEKTKRVLEALDFIEGKIKKDNELPSILANKKSYPREKLIEILGPELRHREFVVRERVRDLLNLGKVTDEDMIDALIKYGLNSYSIGEANEFISGMLREYLMFDRARETLVTRAGKDQSLEVGFVVKALEISGMDRDQALELAKSKMLQPLHERLDQLENEGFSFLNEDYFPQHNVLTKKLFELGDSRGDHIYTNWPQDASDWSSGEISTVGELVSKRRSEMEDAANLSGKDPVELAKKIKKLDAEMAELTAEILHLNRLQPDAIVDERFPKSVSTPEEELEGLDIGEEKKKLRAKYSKLFEEKTEAVARLKRDVDEDAAILSEFFQWASENPYLGQLAVGAILGSAVGLAGLTHKKLNSYATKAAAITAIGPLFGTLLIGAYPVIMTEIGKVVFKIRHPSKVREFFTEYGIHKTVVDNDWVFTFVMGSYIIPITFGVVATTIGLALGEKIHGILSDPDNQVSNDSAALEENEQRERQDIESGEKDAANLGGIDMNAIDIDRKGGGVNIQFDPVAIENFGSVQGFTPVIINFVPIPSVLPLLGLAPRNEEDEIEQELAAAEPALI